MPSSRRKKLATNQLVKFGFFFSWLKVQGGCFGDLVGKFLDWFCFQGDLEIHRLGAQAIDPKNNFNQHPKTSMEPMDWRRRGMAAGSPAADESTVGAAAVVSNAAVVSDAAVVSGAAGASTAVACAADGADGSRAAEEREEKTELAIVGQELVPMDVKQRVSSLEDDSPEKETNPERFQTPGGQKPLGTPDQLQLNTMSLKTNEDSEKKDEYDGKGHFKVNIHYINKLYHIQVDIIFKRDLLKTATNVRS